MIKSLFKRKKKKEINQYKEDLPDVVAYDMYRKCTRVISSCESIGQLNSAVQYCNLFLRKEPQIKNVGPLLEKYCDDMFIKLQNR